MSLRSSLVEGKGVNGIEAQGSRLGSLEEGHLGVSRSELEDLPFTTAWHGVLSCLRPADMENRLLLTVEEVKEDV